MKDRGFSRLFMLLSFSLILQVLHRSLSAIIILIIAELIKIIHLFHKTDILLGIG